MITRIKKILEKFPRWKAYSIGDEDRRNIYINHPRHKELGFLNHKKTLNILNKSKTPPFTIENDTDGGDELRMKYRYLDLRRGPIRKNLELRHQVCRKVRFYLDSNEFIEVETPYLINSTPEGARDFIVPSRMNPKQFYALPQSPQTFKQLLMWVVLINTFKL